MKNCAFGAIAGLALLGSGPTAAAVVDVGISLLRITHATVSKSTVLGEGWEQSVSGGFFPTYSLSETTSHTVSVTFPDSTTFEFAVELNPDTSTLIPFGGTAGLVSDFEFAPVTLMTTTLVPLDAQPDFLFGSSTGPVEFVTFDFDIYDPDRFRFTDASGVSYDLRASSGLESIRNAPGATVILFQGDVLFAVLDGNGSALTGDDFLRDSDGLLFRIGASVLAPVPIPAALPLLVSALTVFRVFGRGIAGRQPRGICAPYFDR